MSVPLYSLRITAVGEYVEYSLRELRLILFSDAVPDDIASYCAVHQASELTAELSPGQQMKLNDKNYRVTAVGPVSYTHLDVYKRQQQHDPRAQAHVERYLDLLAVCLGNILTIVDPDLLVLGGGLSNFTAISEGLAQRLPRHLLPVARVPRIERARHGDAGGMRGAAFLHLTH